MFKNETKNRMMAVVVVAMFVLSAFAMVLAPVNATEYDDASYTINMRVGDQFTYTPNANLDGTTFSWNATSGTTAMTTETGATFTPAANTNGTTFTFIPKSAGSVTVELKAHWTQGTLSQDAVQTLHFVVVEKLSVDNMTYDTNAFKATINLTANSAANNNIKTYTVHGGPSDNAVFSSISVTDSNNGDASSIIGATPSNGNKSLTISNVVNPTAGTYHVTATVSYTHDAKLSDDAAASTSSETKNVDITVIVANGLTLSSDSSSAVLNEATTVANSGNPVTTSAQNTEAVTGLTITNGTLITGTGKTTGWAGKSGAGASDYLSAMVLTQDGNDISIALPTGTKWANTVFSGQSATLDFNIHMVGTTADGNVVADIPYTLTLYAALKFTTTPIIDGTASFTSSNTGLDVLISSTIVGAKKITYNWGDGTEYIKNNYGVDNNFFTANHTYAKAGTYMIQITASNDFGDKTYITPYSTGFDFLSGPSEKKLEVGKISSTTEDGQMTLSTVVNITDGITPTYKWMIKEKDAETAVDASTHEAFVSQDTSSVKKTIVLDTSKLKDDTKITFQASYTFEGDTEATVKESNYTYNDTTSFMEKHGLLFIVFLILGIISIALMRFGFEFMPYQYIIGFVLIVVAIAAFFTNDFGLALWKF